ncbi:MAG: hypothetical protein ABI528_01025 [bacterium]
MKKILWKGFLTVMILLALYRLTSYSQTPGSNGIPESETVIVQKNFELYQNEPERFNEVTNIRFKIIEKGDALLQVNDAEGKLIDVLVDGEMEPGEYNVYYKAVTTLEEGEYSYTLDVNGEKQTKRMFILKH